jgi:hypothetical protein
MSQQRYNDCFELTKCIKWKLVIEIDTMITRNIKNIEIEPSSNTYEEMK